MATEKENRIAVFALTRGGVELGEALGRLFSDIQLMVPSRFKSRQFVQETVFFDDWNGAVREAFKKYRQLVFIMATGIVVRTLAPLLESKYTDPGVVVLDERGSFAISLLSGHLGGANALANKLSRALKCTPVITTATDVNGVIALDSLAADLECRIYPRSQLKVFNRLLAEGERIPLFSQWPLKHNLGEGLKYIPGTMISKEGVGVYITNRLLPPDNEARLILRPRNLVAGVGCRKGVSRDLIVSALKRAFRLGGLSLLSLKCLASIDIKMKEIGLCQGAEYFKVPLVQVDRENIEELTGQYTPSDFVKEIIGVGGVCEPASMIASGMGKIVVPKQKLGPVTVALAEEKLWWWA
ncbi:cobalt-precorrin 5A hydrolase [Desulforamulus aquiferis]|uniref:Cobalt-precorrin 5A hydrolase n=1 Tax=Desulforamulus aquiferis TaxID=1397668 RepID=A0AAW7ZAB6_9FIRM|nr:cobalt-precorrin 5A hydrolase [Desulforamulus aquiferis]MDO7786355.1 cobalt-precorrin 5A hydrolase [Desulforamulus aquiferis]